jgi:LAO/AO transport system kinase
MQISGLANQGLDQLWSEVERHRAVLAANGELDRKRAAQNVKWMWTLLEERLKARLFESPGAKARLAEIVADVAGGALAPEVAVERILAASKA